MKRKKRIALVYIIWGLFLQHHLFASAHIRLVLHGYYSGIPVLLMYLIISFCIIWFTLSFLQPFSDTRIKVALYVFASWVFSFFMFSGIISFLGKYVRYENFLFLLIWYFGAHLVVPVAPALVAYRKSLAKHNKSFNLGGVNNVPQG